ncbi:MAG: hypothetical protein DLM63_02900 [Solirubrobacterales bacterium]|nr:MAG: hypothetical protein DLM63_02900 [Solirubrobacterales bacterium]
MLKISIATQEDTQMVKRRTALGTAEVTADGEGLVSHAGVALLVELADCDDLTAGLSEALAGTRERRSAHDPGRVLRDVAVMLADGGDCVSDIDAYRDQGPLFDARASETTTHRVLKSIDEQLLDRMRAARAKARAAWRALRGCLRRTRPTLYAVRPVCRLREDHEAPRFEPVDTGIPANMSVRAPWLIR